MTKNKKVKSIIIDMEWTCWGPGDKIPDNKLKEILAIGALKVDDNFNTIGAFSRTIKPSINQKLSSYCMELTGLKQKTIDNSQYFSDVISSLERWIDKNPEFESIYFWGDKDKTVLLEQAEYLCYTGKILDLIMDGKVLDIQPIVLQDIHNKLNITMRISLRGTKLLYGINTPVTHDPLKDAEDVRHLWRIKNHHKAKFNEELLSSARHMYVLNQLMKRVMFIEKETAWLSQANYSKKKKERVTKVQADKTNRVKLEVFYHFLSRITSDNIFTFIPPSVHTIVKELNLNSKSNYIVATLHRDIYNTSDWRYEIIVNSVEDKIPMEVISNRGFKLYKDNANIVDNGLINKSINITENNINITLGKVVYNNKDTNKRHPKIILVINGVIFFIEHTNKNKNAYKDFMDVIKSFNSEPYPLHG